MQQPSTGKANDRGYQGLTVGFVAVLTIILAATVSLCGIAYLNHLSSELIQENFVEVKNQALQEMVGAQERALARREWVDQAKGTARIPIEDAIKAFAEAEKDGQ